ncbi:MAG: hypothetical protein HKN81_01990 [Gammaproteobacteria bacterium]|nr:hypothetical protein [Gammaproteobacteria bacterium]
MARLDLVAIRKALADQIRPAVPNTTAYRPDSVATGAPTVWVDMPPVQKLTFQPGAVWNIPLTVVLAVGDTWDRTSQQTVDELIVDIWEVVDGDKTLGGTVSAAVATEFTPVTSAENRGWVGGLLDVKVSLNATLAS